MHKLISIFTFVLLYVAVSFAQATVELPFDVADNDGGLQPLILGLDVTATGGLDLGLGESELPPPPPTGVFDARFVSNAQSTLGQGSLKDIRNASGFPFSGTYIHQIKFQTGGAGTEITVSWNLPPEVAAGSEIHDVVTGTLVQAAFVGVGSVVVTNPAVFNQLEIVIVYNNIGPAGPAPEFSIAPTSLDFGIVELGVPATLQATVTNTGTDPLDITDIASTDGQFTFSPAAPINLPAGGSQIFDMTFTPSVLGLSTADIVFTHNAPGSPTNYPVQGTGADAGPTFSVTPASLNFGSVPVGVPTDLNVTVTNTGITNTLNISSAATGTTEFSVAPASASIAPGGSQIFTVTFTAPAGGSYTDDLTFTHDAPTSPDVVPLSGSASATFGLSFVQDTVWNLEEAFYMEEMQLTGIPVGEDIQAMQFRLTTNQNVDDETILTFQSMVKGSDIAADPSWVLDYNVKRGLITANGASKDTIYVLLYNLNQNNGLMGGTNYFHLFEVNYRVANLNALQDTVKSSFLITHEEASTFEGYPVNITPLNNELVVNGVNRVGSLGDVNGDGCLDILDLIKVVDHIVGRDSLYGEEFTRADIAPWIPGNALPDPDGLVNVQDLSVIQNIILTGVFPDGTPMNYCGPGGFPKLNGDADAILSIYINKEGISTYMDSQVGIRGAQIEFGSVSNNPGNLVINTDLGQGYYLHANEMLRTLLYDRLAEKYIEAGEHFLADMPFQISNPEDITIEKIVLVDINKQKLTKIQVEIFYGTVGLPLDYILFQNYPNPFNPTTAVRFQLPKTSNVTVKIYDMLGQEVRTLFAGETQRGTYTVHWDGLNDAGLKMSSGSYIYRMTAGDFVQSKKMLLLK